MVLNTQYRILHTDKGGAILGNLASELKEFERHEHEQATQALAAQLKLPYVSLLDYPILPDVLRLISEAEATAEHVVTYLRAGDVLKVATDRPGSATLGAFLKQLANRTKSRVALAVCSAASFADALSQYQLAAANSPLIAEVLREATTPVVAQPTTPTYATSIASLTQLAERARRVNTSELLDVLFAGALGLHASDIHLEPQEDTLRVRYRIDGVLLEAVRFERETFQALRNRVKYLAKLKLDVAGLPQDGRFEYRVGDAHVDVRASSLPGLYGEILSLRILPHEKEFIALAHLGFSPAHLATIASAKRRPHGILLATGPTGSGKTTTLYALLATVNRPEVKIVTLEDPIEYRLAGIDQSQVNSGGDYTFARGLRSALRQDPDILMVGEIRDGETATIAIEAAMTGHLVLSTLHTNDAAGAIPRLLEMGVKPFLLSGVINLIIAQRLVRKICSRCHGSETDRIRNQESGIRNNPTVPPATGTNSPDSLFVIRNSPTKSASVGCEQCHFTGYQGRIAIAELLVPNRAIEDLIVAQGSAAAFAEVAAAAGMQPMAADGLAKANQGLTDTAEIERVTGVTTPGAAAIVSQLP